MHTASGGLNPPDCLPEKFMRDLFAEFLVVFTYSTKTQLALLLGIAVFAGLQVAGMVMPQGIALNSLPEPATTALRDSLAYVFEVLSWIGLAGSVSTAAKCYARDRRRLFEI